MLVIPADGTWRSSSRGSRRPRARLCPPAAAGDLPVVTWEEGATRMRSWPSWSSSGRRPPRRRTAGSPSRTISPARHLLPLQHRLPEAPFSLASAVLRELRMVKDADEIALLRLAAQAADRVVAQIAGGPAGRPDRGRRRRRGPRAAGRRGSRRGHVRDRRIGAQLGVAAPRGVRPDDPGRRPDRARYRRHRSAATPRTSRGRCG